MAKKPLYHNHPLHISYTVDPQTFFFKRCDDCGKRRLFQRLREVYSSTFDFGWWYGCYSCIVYDRKKSIMADKLACPRPGVL